MAQSFITIAKVVDAKGSSKYWKYEDFPVPPKRILQSLESANVGSDLLYYSKHYDPTSIAPIDLILNTIFVNIDARSIRRFHEDSVDIIIVDLPSNQKQLKEWRLQRGDFSISEVEILASLVLSAAGFWQDLIISNEIKSYLIIGVERLAPSLQDEEFIKVILN